MMKLLRVGAAARGASLTVMVLALVGGGVPLQAQDAGADARLRKLEGEVRAIQRKVFPGADGKFFAPEITPTPGAAATTPGVPASTPVTDMLARMDSLERQLAGLTAQTEQNSNRIAQIEAKLAPPAPANADPAMAPSAGAPAASAANLSAMTGGAATPRPAPVATPTPALAPTPAPAARPAAAAAAAPKPVAPSAARVAAVRAVEKPSTGNAGDDEYSYGFRLWDAKLYPEAQQQLKLMVDKYPRDPKISYARNLLGRAYLDDGKPREAASWFLQNYQADKVGARAADSLLFLGESMRRLNDTNRACVALAEFARTYPAEAAGRLKGQYDQTRAGVKCPS
ncbi:MAG TPA: hypothetical protein VF440_05920 [Novosphingobium sp.]